MQKTTSFQKLLRIEFPETEPANNLTIEKSLLQLAEPGVAVLRFWRNDPCLIMGRFQKSEYEIADSITSEQKIPVLRRFTGGGTVYHDHGTLNISFMRHRSDIFFERSVLQEAHHLVQLIADAINPGHLKLTINSRNNLFYGDQKLLGSAAALVDNRLIFHCSLLHNTNLNELENSIKTTPDYPKTGRFIPSHRSPVINLSEICNLYPEEISHKITHLFVNKITPNSVQTIRSQTNFSLLYPRVSLK